jgi:rhodanese-related sulfurtransferase
MRALIRILALVLAMSALPAWSAETISPEKLGQQVEAGKAPLILDVRTEEEYLEGHVPGARLIPHDRIGEYMDSLSEHKNEPIVVYCRSGNRTEKAIDKLEKADFSQVIELEGSFQAWKQTGQTVEQP